MLRVSCELFCNSLRWLKLVKVLVRTPDIMLPSPDKVALKLEDTKLGEHERHMMQSDKSEKSRMKAWDRFQGIQERIHQIQKHKQKVQSRKAYLQALDMEMSSVTRATPSWKAGS